MVANVKLFAYAIVNLCKRKDSFKRRVHRRNNTQSMWNIFQIARKMTLPYSLAIEMPCLPVINYGEIQGSDPCLRAEQWDLKIMVSAALTRGSS
jgi:hypothetical protein